jgi:hypothetical protein
MERSRRYLGLDALAPQAVDRAITEEVTDLELQGITALTGTPNPRINLYSTQPGPAPAVVDLRGARRRRSKCRSARPTRLIGPGLGQT